MGKQAERHLLQPGSTSRGPTSLGWGSQMVRERGLAAKATYFPHSHGHQPVREMQIKPPQLVPVGRAGRAPLPPLDVLVGAGSCWQHPRQVSAVLAGVWRAGSTSRILLLVYFSFIVLVL